MKTTYTIYKHYNIITNKVYIGVTKKYCANHTMSRHIKSKHESN